MTPTARTLKYLRDHGHTAGVVEKWIPQTKQRLDLFGFIDICSLHPDFLGVLGVQATSASNHAARVKKTLGIPAARLWLQTGNRIAVVSWAKKGPRGKRKLWEHRIEDITLPMFDKDDPS